MKVLITGLGSISRRHINAIRNLHPRAEIFALRSGKTENSVPGVRDIYSLEEQNNTYDFIIISNPTSLHIGTIEELMYLETPLFIEKPLSNTLDGIEKTEKELKDRDIKTYVACNLRFHPCIEYMKENLPGKRINEVNVYCGSYLPDWRPDRDFRELYSSKPELGGGVHLDLVHEIDYCYYLFGKPVHVKRYFSSKSSLGIESVDYANYILEYDGFNVNIILNYYRKPARRTVEILFPDKTWLADLSGFEIRDAGQLVFTSNSDMSGTYLEQMKYFTEIVLAGKPHFNSFSEAKEVLQICV